MPDDPTPQQTSGTPDPGGSAAPGNAEPGQQPASTTPAPAAKPGEGAPEHEPVDIDQLQSEYDELSQKVDRLRGQISARDQAFNQAVTERDQLARQLDDLRMADMDETERAAYERDRALAEAQQYREALEQQRYETEVQRRMDGWKNYFVTQGVPATELDASTYDDLMRSGTEYLARKVGGGAPGSQQTQPGSGGRPRPPAITQHGPGSPPPGRKRMADLPYKEQVELLERFERGEIPADQLPV